MTTARQHYNASTGRAWSLSAFRSDYHLDAEDQDINWGYSIDAPDIVAAGSVSRSHLFDDAVVSYAIRGH